jgi:hypothetical protein
MSTPNLPIPKNEEPKKESYSEWASRNYNEGVTNWKPWLEDQYLSWFGKDNKASYAAKRKLYPQATKTMSRNH